MSKELRRETKSWTERLEISYLELLVETLPVLLGRNPGSDKTFYFSKTKTRTDLAGLIIENNNFNSTVKNNIFSSPDSF